MNANIVITVSGGVVNAVYGQPGLTVKILDVDDINEDGRDFEKEHAAAVVGLVELPHSRPGEVS